jgi:peroxiredoxin
VIRPKTLLLFCASLAYSQDKPSDKKVVYTKQELPLVSQVRILNDLPEDKRGLLIKDTAFGIRRLPASLNKLRLADSLAFVSTAGDPGHATLQEVGTTLADALREQPGKLDSAYVDLAQLVHYEHITVSLDDPQFETAMSRLEADDQHRREVNFTLVDLKGKSWTLKDLRGKVVLVNFWASWSRPCRQEMLDLEGLYQLFKKQDLVILAISSENREQVENFVKAQKITFSVLSDPEQKAAQLYRLLKIPKTFVYDRAGNLVAQAIDVRTQTQLRHMLEQTGLGR